MATHQATNLLVLRGSGGTKSVSFRDAPDVAPRGAICVRKQPVSFVQRPALPQRLRVAGLQRGLKLRLPLATLSGAVTVATTFVKRPIVAPSAGT